MPHRQNPQSMPASREPTSLVAVDRAVSELRRGRAVVIAAADGGAVLALAGEAVDGEAVRALSQTAQGKPVLAITRRRAIRLGLAGDAVGDDRLVLGITFADVPDESQDLNAERLSRLVDPLLSPEPGDTEGANVVAVARHGAETAAVGLAKIARLLPAALVAAITDPEAEDLAPWALRHDLAMVDAGDVFQFERTAARTLKRVSEARVPLADAEGARVLAYRPMDGGLEHIAIVIGEPGADENVPLVRLHSECFTGDLLGSLRCDCGDQLRGALAAIAKDGAGVLVYLAQEGRGIGLANKLRAYTLQDGGLDTLDANEELGFDADERVYLPAAQILKDLGLKQVRLLTNNPDKVTALSGFGIDVVRREPHAFPANRHNERYLEAKRVKGGHLF